MNNIQIIMGTDPGLQGSIAVLIGEAPIVWDVPTLQTESVKNGKKIKRRDYDLEAMRNLLLPFHGQNVIFSIESASSRPGEGSRSSFTFGRGFGYWQAFAVAFDFHLLEISPRKWKSDYPEITQCAEILKIKDKIKGIRSDIKALEAQRKAVKDKGRKRDITKDIKSLEKGIEKENRQIKATAKTKARILASSLYPDISDRFKLVKDADRAEATLIARYTKEHYDELV